MTGGGWDGSGTDSKDKAIFSAHQIELSVTPEQAMKWLQMVILLISQSLSGSLYEWP